MPLRPFGIKRKTHCHIDQSQQTENVRQLRAIVLKVREKPEADRNEPLSQGHQSTIPIIILSLEISSNISRGKDDKNLLSPQCKQSAPFVSHNKITNEESAVYTWISWTEVHSLK